MVARTSEIIGHEDTVHDRMSTGLQASDYLVEKLQNGLTRVFCRASKLVACFNPDGTYRHGDLGIPRWISEEERYDHLTLDETLCWLDERDRKEAQPCG